MAAAVAMLDALRKKPVAEKKKQFSVAFFVASVAPKHKHKHKHAEQLEEEQEQNVHEERQEEQLEEEQEQNVQEKQAHKKPNPTVMIVDKASLKLVNRDDILARIKAARGIVRESAPHPLNLTAAKVVSIVEEAPVPKLKGRKLQKIKLVPVSSQSIEKVTLPEVAEVAAADVAAVEEVLEPLKNKRGTRKAKVPAQTKALNALESQQQPQPQQQQQPEPVKKSNPIGPLVASEYYLNTREKFVEFINKLFQKKYRAEIVDESAVVSCEDRRSAEQFGLLTHQKIVKD